MLKRIKKSKPAPSEWASSIRELRHRLGMNQVQLGQRLHFSPMAVSRWERGEQEPTDRAYIELGNLAGDPDCWYFWGRAGLHNENLLSVTPVLRDRLQKSRFADFQIVSAGGTKKNPAKLPLVAIPVLKAVAAAIGEKGGDPSSLLAGPVESMIAAPKDWCPNPAATSCLRVRGTSMTPLIPDGAIIVVDSSQTDHMKLDGKVVVAWHRDQGLAVSRFKRYDHTEILEPENRGYDSITLSAKQRWTIVAKVLWWIGKAP